MRPVLLPPLLCLLLTGGAAVRAQVAPAAAAPQIVSVFPVAGSAQGGTVITIRGTGFEGALVAEVGGVPAAVVLFQAPDTLAVLAPSLPVGPQDVSVSRADGTGLEDVAPGAFLAVDAPDPALLEVDPPLLAGSGGDTIVVAGSGFLPDAQVELFTDPADGSDGVPAPTTWLGPGLLEAVVPAGPLGPATVSVTQGAGQVALLPGGVSLVPLLAHRDRVHGALGEPGQVQVAWLDGVAGTELTVRMRRQGPGGLRPCLTVRDPSGDVLLSSDPQSPAYDGTLASAFPKRARLLRLPLPVTGRYTLEASGLGPETGLYRLAVREHLPPAARSLALPKGAAFGPGPLPLELLAKPGTRVSGTLRAKGGLAVRLERLEAPDGTVLVEADGSGALTGDPALLAALQLDPEGRFLRLKKLPLEQLGTWLLVLGAEAGTSGPLTGKLRLRAPRSHTLYEL